MLLRIYKRIYAYVARRSFAQFRGFRIINRLILPLLTKNVVLTEGHRMFLDSKDSLRISIWGTYATGEKRLAEREVRPGDVALDIGANIGFLTLILARLVGETGRVYAFEPDPVNFDLLTKNVEINGYQNVITVPYAVSNESGDARLYLSESNRGDHRIYDPDAGRASIDIQTVTVDHFFNDYV